MSDSYYVRSQGKVQGPFSFEDLKAKAGKGHLKKTHQVSTDQKIWQSARRMEGLFPPPPKLPQRQPQKREEPALVEPELVEVTLIEDVPPALIDEETEWHYCLHGDEETQGPISETKLRRLFQSGRLPLDALVWNETLSGWVEATRIPALHPAPVARPVLNTDILIDEIEPEFPPIAGDDLSIPPLASASLTLGILGIAIPVGICSVLAIIFGHLALSQIQSNRRLYQGESMAKTGLILGYIVLTFLLLAGSVWLILQVAES